MAQGRTRYLPMGDRRGYVW